MSYLNFPRLSFTGQFQADVSTVNNDPRHFDNSTFEPYFQDFTEGTQCNGWWNPIGTGIFRLSNCLVTSALGLDGKLSDAGVLGLVVGNSPDLPSAKLVDLDPDWQLASCIFGLTISLVTPLGQVVMQGDYQPNPFRDLWFNRVTGADPGDETASAMFQSVLTNIQWNLDGINSAFLQALKTAADNAGGMLSVRLTTYGYNGDNTSPSFSYGKVVGAIGPVLPNEPTSFVLGRRFMPTGSQQSDTLNITCFSSVIDQGTNTLQADFSNALPTDDNFRISPLGTLTCVVLNDASIQQGATVTSSQYVVLGSVQSTDLGQTISSGIQSFPISSEAATLLSGNYPLALIQPNPAPETGSAVVIMEAPNGLEIRAEQFAFRLDPNNPTGNTMTTTVYAAQYGKPISNPQIAVKLNDDDPDTNNCPTSVPADTTPKAAIPNNNTPTGTIQFSYTQGAAPGQIAVTFQGPQSFGTPRSYMDGQIYYYNYNFASGPQAAQQQFDVFVALVFSSFTAPAKPAWTDVQPILLQYANLYPVMSKGLFDFSQQAVADANAHTMYAVFNNSNFEDPDYMPVTRDLSYSKRETLKTYFSNVIASMPSETLKDTRHRFAARCPFGFGRKAAE